MPATATRRRTHLPYPKITETTKKAVSEFERATKDARAPSKASETMVRNMQDLPLDALLQRIHAERLPKMLKQMESYAPEKATEMKEFLEHHIKLIQAWQQQGHGNAQIAHAMQKRLEELFEHLYPQSHYNKRRVQIVLNFLKADEILH